MSLRMRKTKVAPPECPLTECMSLIGGAWTPNVIFFLIGLYLLRLRATNRETPSFNPVVLWRNVRAT